MVKKADLEIAVRLLGSYCATWTNDLEGLRECFSGEQLPEVWAQVAADSIVRACDARLARQLKDAEGVGISDYASALEAVERAERGV